MALQSCDDAGPVRSETAHDVKQVVIAKAIYEFTDYARRHAHRKALNINPQATPAEVERQRVEVNLLCDLMDALGQTDASYYSEFQQLRIQMGPHFPPAPRDYAVIVEDSYRAAGRIGPDEQVALRAEAA